MGGASRPVTRARSVPSADWIEVGRGSPATRDCGAQGSPTLSASPDPRGHCWPQSIDPRLRVHDVSEVS